MILLTKLILAHLIGDFFLQPQSWVNDKETRKLKSPKLYLHTSIHIILLFILVWDITFWSMLLTIGLLHFVIDVIKLFVQNKSNNRLLFFTDQALHIIVIICSYLYFTNTDVHIGTLITEQHMLLAVCLVFLTLPTSVMMKVVFSKWDISKLANGKKSLKNAGTYIGVLERILVFIFVILGRWEAVGFLITAKSVFRFGDLTAAKQRKLTEYVLIGTLISFGIAILTGLLYLQIISVLM